MAIVKVLHVRASNKQPWVPWADYLARTTYDHGSPEAMVLLDQLQQEYRDSESIDN